MPSLFTLYIPPPIAPPILKVLVTILIFFFNFFTPLPMRIFFESQDHLTCPLLHSWSQNKAQVTVDTHSLLNDWINPSEFCEMRNSVKNDHRMP